MPSSTSATGMPQPPTPARGNTRFNRPPLPLPSPQKQTYRQPPPPPQSIRHNNDRTGKEFNRRERRFESIFDQWSKEVARLQEKHRAVSLKCRNEEESTMAMDIFNRKVQAVMTRYNEEIAALQISSSEPPSSQSDDKEDEDKDDEDDEDEETSEEDGEEEEDLNHRVDGPPKHALGDNKDGDERALTRIFDALHVDISSGDDTDHSARFSQRSAKSYQSSEVSQGSLNLNTPPPTENDEDHRATRRRQARERRKTDELASALPLRLRSETLRKVSPAGAAPAPRPAAKLLFENMSSSPASISPMPGQSLGSPYSSRRPSRDVPTTRPSPIKINPAAVASRIDYLRRRNSSSGLDRSLSKNRESSPVDERSLFKDQFEAWKTAIQSQSETLLKTEEKGTEDARRKFLLDQEEKHQRAQLIFLAEQERHLQRNRAVSTGSTTASGGSSVGSHPISSSFAVPHAHGTAPSISPTLQRGVPPPVLASSSPSGRPFNSRFSQTLYEATGLSRFWPQQSSSRTWVPRTVPVATQPEDQYSTGSPSGLDALEGVVEGKDENGQPAYKGTSPISNPNSAPGSFDMGHHRTSSQVYSGTSGASSTPRNPFPQHLRNPSLTTLSSNGIASSQSSANTPGSRRGSVGEKTFVPPTSLHGESRKNVNSLTVENPPPNQQPRWLHGSILGSVDAPGGVNHGPTSTFSRTSGDAAAATIKANSGVNIPLRAAVQHRHTASSASSLSATSAVPPISNSSSIGPGSSPRLSPVGPLSIGQPPGKISWKSIATGKPSPPIPIQTRPESGSISSTQRNWPNTSSGSGSFPTVTTPVPFESARASPSLQGSMSNADLVSTTETHAEPESRPFTSAFAIRDHSLGRPSRSKSPKMPGVIPAKVISPAEKIFSSPHEQSMLNQNASSPKPESQPEMIIPLREQKRKPELRQRAKKELADLLKRQEDLERREEELKRRETELEREMVQDNERQREEGNLLRREAELRNREEELRRQEAEIAELKRRKQAEAKLRRQREAEEESRRKEEVELKRRQTVKEARQLQEEVEAEAEAEHLRKKAEAEAETKRQQEEEERQARRSLEESERHSYYALKESRKKDRPEVAHFEPSENNDMVESIPITEDLRTNAIVEQEDTSTPTNDVVRVDGKGPQGTMIIDANSQKEELHHQEQILQSEIQQSQQENEMPSESIPASEGVASPLHDTSVGVFLNSSESLLPSLENLMKHHTPMDLTGLVSIPDRGHPEHGGLADVHAGLLNGQQVREEISVYSF